MPKFLPVLFTLLLPALLWAQNPAPQPLVDSREVILEGIELYDNESYEEAAEEFAKVNRFDTNFTWAVYELGLTKFAQEEYELAVKYAKQALALNDAYVEAYTLLGNALDELDRTDEAIAAYDQGLELYPFSHMLWLNKGILYEKAEQYDKAYEVYQGLLEFNPMFSSTHLRLGLMCVNQGHISQALLSLSTFLMLEPASGRSLNVLSYMNTTADGGSKDLGSVKVKKGIPAEMADIDFLVNNEVGLNKKYKTPSKFTYSVVKQMHLIIEQSKEQPGEGFWWEFYIPVYQKMMANEDFATYSTYLLASSTQDDVQKRLNKDISKVKAFRTWFIGEWFDQHKSYDWNGRTVHARYYDNAALLAFGDETDEGSFTGDVTYFYIGGSKKSSGVLNENGNRDGTWHFFFENGDTSQIIRYKDGDFHGEYTLFYEHGQIKETGVFNEGKTNGPSRTYHPSGAIKVEEEYVDGKAEGVGKRYYPHGQVEYEYVQKAGELNGEFKNYYPNGNLRDHKFFEDGVLIGQRKQYFENGQLSTEQTYVDDVLEGPYKTYFPNGQVESEGIAAKGNVAGDWKYYFSDGTLRESSTYDENGKVTGEELTYAYDGKLISKHVFQKGEIKELEIYDESGAVIYESALSRGKIEVKNYTSNRDLYSEGSIEKENSVGVWMFYHYSGALDEEKTYKDGMVHGTVKGYYPNGAKYYEFEMVEDEREGLYEEYEPQGNLIQTGYYADGERWGMWYDYHNDGQLSTEAYMSDGWKKNQALEYRFNGQLMSRNVYNDEGWFVGYALYDTTGKLIDSTGAPNGTGTMVTKFEDGQISWTGSYLDGKANGSFKWYYPNGQLSSEGEIAYGNRIGEWKWYWPDGSIKEVGHYENGYRHGSWIMYHFGAGTSWERTYEFGEIHGKSFSYDRAGKLESQTEYYEGNRHGISNYYAPTGELKIARFYSHGKLYGYTYEDGSGNLKPMIKIENGTADIVAYYSNGQKSVEYNIKNGWFDGKFLHFAPNGKPLIEGAYLNDEMDGPRKEYYASGALMLSRPCKLGEYHGPYEERYENGKLCIKGNYVMGERHGAFEYFDKTGKLIHTMIYDSGDCMYQR